MAPASTENQNLVPEPVSKLDAAQPNADGSSLSEHDRAEMAFVDKYSAPDVYIKADQTFWFPWIGPIEIKPMRLETRSGTFVMGLRSKVAASLGKHRHRGTVTAVTMKGEWGYKEYDWVARTGDWVCENPGTIHTLGVEDDTDIVFTVTGCIEFLNDDDSIKFTFDLFSFAKLYYDECEKRGVKPLESVWH